MRLCGDGEETIDLGSAATGWFEWHVRPPLRAFLPSLFHRDLMPRPIRICLIGILRHNAYQTRIALLSAYTVYGCLGPTQWITDLTHRCLCLSIRAFLCRTCVDASRRCLWSIFSRFLPSLMGHPHGHERDPAEARCYRHVFDATAKGPVEPSQSRRTFHRRWRLPRTVHVARVSSSETNQQLALSGWPPDAAYLTWFSVDTDLSRKVA